MGVQYEQDHFFHKAKKEGYRARSVYKLQEIQQKFGLLRPGMRVVDLGAAPGSWSQYLGEVVGASGRVVAIDLHTIAPGLPEPVVVVKGDAFEMTPDALRELAGGPLTAVLSDMAPRTSGVKGVDHLKSVALCERAMALADALLPEGGALVVKVFQGGDLDGLRAQLRERYAKVRTFKPRSSRRDSVEIFLVAEGFTGAPPQEAHPPLPDTSLYDPMAEG